PGATVGQAYSFTVTAGGFPAPTFSATGLPPGLAVNPTTGAITRTPTPAGALHRTLPPTHAAPSADHALSLRVPARLSPPPPPTPPGPGWAVCTVPGPPPGVSSTFVFTADGRSQPLTTFTPFPGVVADVRAANADVDGDGVADQVYVPGPGGGDLVRIVSGKDG